MKKTEIINAITNNNGTLNNDGVYEITTENYNNLLFDVDGVKINNVDKKTHQIKCGKCIITIVEKKPRNKKTENVKTVSGGNGVKSKNAHYIIMLKNYNEKLQTIDNITCCADIKLWLKTINRKNIEYLRIYDHLKNPCRKSAWVERENNA